MIRYEITPGDKTFNQLARAQRDQVYKPLLRGMHCRKHSQDTVIKLVPYGSTAKPEIHACCNDFDNRIRQKLFPGR